jgi:hypothetical protein
VLGLADGPASAPRLERLAPGLARLTAPRGRRSGESLPTPRHLREGVGEARAWLAVMAGYAVAPDAVLIDRLGGHVGATVEFERFRKLCARVVDDTAALLAAAERPGLPDLVVAVGLPALFAAAALAQDGVALAYWATGRWPHEQGDFQHWESEFWASAERRLGAGAIARVAEPGTAAARLEAEHGLSFAPAPDPDAIWRIAAGPLAEAHRAPLEEDAAWFAGWPAAPLPPRRPALARLRRALARRLATRR